MRDISVRFNPLLFAASRHDLSIPVFQGISLGRSSYHAGHYLNVMFLSRQWCDLSIEKDRIRLAVDVQRRLCWVCLCIRLYGVGLSKYVVLVCKDILLCRMFNIGLFLFDAPFLGFVGS